MGACGNRIDVDPVLRKPISCTKIPKVESTIRIYIYYGREGNECQIFGHDRDNIDFLYAALCT